MVSGWNLWFIGYPDRAVERLNVATAIANAGVKTMLADIHGFASYVHELRREPEQMKARAEARLAFNRIGLPSRQGSERNLPRLGRCDSGRFGARHRAHT